MANKKQEKHLYFFEDINGNLCIENDGLEMTEIEFLNYINSTGNLIDDEDITYYRIPKEKMERFEIEITLNKF